MTPVAPRSVTIRSVKGPVIMFVVALVLVTALLVLWNVVLAVDFLAFQKLLETETEKQQGVVFHWTFIAIGSGLFVATIVLLSVLGAQLFTQIRFSQRLANSIATFTHELNSPLAAIKMFAQTLRQGDLSPEDQRRFLDRILIDVERLSRTISNTLQATQLDSLLGFKIAPQPIDLRAYLEDYVETQQVLLERHEKDLRLELVKGPSATISLDKVAFRHVLDNLVDNAFKYGKPEGTQVEIAILTGQREDQIQLEIRDDGQGIPEKELEHVFERYRRYHGDAGRRPGGTGLGLWISEAIVAAHNGRISAHSEGVGQGTTIRIQLPLGKGRQGATAEPDSESEEEESNERPPLPAEPVVGQEAQG